MKTDTLRACFKITSEVRTLATQRIVVMSPATLTANALLAASGGDNYVPARCSCRCHKTIDLPAKHAK